jgi:hypothetical protein
MSGSRMGGVQAGSSHSGTASTRTFDVNVSFMQLQRHGWDIHVL